MEKASHEQVKILANIFEAAEGAKLTEKDVEGELRQAGISSHLLVEDVQKLVSKLSNIRSESGHQQLPMAASKKEDHTKNDMIEFLKKGKKLKDS